MFKRECNQCHKSVPKLPESFREELRELPKNQSTEMVGWFVLKTPKGIVWTCQACREGESEEPKKVDEGTFHTGAEHHRTAEVEIRIEPSYSYHKIIASVKESVEYHNLSEVEEKVKKFEAIVQASFLRQLAFIKDLETKGKLPRRC
jgi:hypothetical protein